MLLGNALIFLMLKAGMFQTFTLDNPATPLLLLFVNLFIFLIWWTQRWIVVEYQDEAGALQQAYYSDAASLGWGGMLGGTKRMYQAMLAHLLPPGSPVQPLSPEDIQKDPLS
jgi:hypothetical protein